MQVDSFPQSQELASTFTYHAYGHYGTKLIPFTDIHHPFPFGIPTLANRDQFKRSTVVFHQIVQWCIDFAKHHSIVKFIHLGVSGHPRR